VAVLVSAAMHLYLWFEGYRDLEVIGPAFLLNAVGGAVIAVLVLAWKHWLPALLTLGFGASTLGAFVVSTTVGLFGVQEQWRGWEVWTAAISEAAAIVLGALLLARQRPTSGREPQHHAAVRRPHLD
jgi:putative intracellular protease/amidase